MKRRIAKLEHAAGHACDGLVEQIKQAALNAVDIESLEVLAKYMDRGGQESDATEQERLAAQKLSEALQAEALRISGRSWAELQRAGLISSSRDV